MRLATLDDLDILYQLCLNFYQASTYNWPLHEMHGKQFLKTLVSNQEYLGLLQDDNEGKVVGCLLAVATDHPFFPVRIANEIVWWTEPEYRSRDSLKLLETYEYWAIEVQKCSLVCLTSSDDPRVKKLYERKGYTLKEQTFYKEVI